MHLENPGDWWSWVRRDAQQNPVRFACEVLGMLITLSASLILALTTPLPPMLLLYGLWNCANVLLLYISYSRGSLGLTVLFSGFLVVDLIGLWRTIP
jgi:hypothetical protein